MMNAMLYDVSDDNDKPDDDNDKHDDYDDRHDDDDEWGRWWELSNHDLSPGTQVAQLLPLQKKILFVCKKN